MIQFRMIPRNGYVGRERAYFVSRRENMIDIRYNMI